MIHLAPFTLDDFDTLASWIHSEHELIQFSGPIFTYPLDKMQVKHYLEDNNRHVFKVIVSENSSDTPKMVGVSEIYHDNEQTAKLCRILVGHPDMRGKGLGQKIIQSLLSKAFNDMNYERVHLNVFDWNIGAIKCYEKVGFVRNPLVNRTVTVGDEQWALSNMTIDKIAIDKIAGQSTS